MFFKLEKGDIGQLKNKKLLLFGAGSRGSYFLEELSKIGAEVVGFIDNDKMKWGGVYNRWIYGISTRICIKIF